MKKDRTIIFIPEERDANLTRTASWPKGASSRMHRHIDKASILELSGTVVDMDENGLFPIDVPTGRYLVCTADNGISTGTTYYIGGCDTVKLTPDSSLKIYLVWGRTRVSVN